MAAAWGAETEGGDENPAPPARVLNQDEIDSLLGFDLSDGGGETHRHARSSTRPWSPTSVCRCWRSCSTGWCGMMTTSLRNFTSDNVEVGLDNIPSLRFGDYLNSIPLPAMLAVFQAEERDNYGLMAVDSA